MKKHFHMTHNLVTNLLVRVDIDVALYTLLTHISPGVPAHPFSFALRTLIFSKTSFLALIWGQTFTFWTSLAKKVKTRLSLLKTQTFNSETWLILCHVFIIEYQSPGYEV